MEWPAELIQQIRADIVDAFMRLPHGGLEIAGVLFGTRIGPTLHISATRPIDCQHARGPALVLSDRDQHELERLLNESRADSALNGLEPVGWYVSHTRRPFELADSDSTVFDRFFSEPMRVTVVVRPEATGEAHFRLFTRNEDGSVDRQNPSQEFTARPERGKPGNHLPDDSERPDPEPLRTPVRSQRDPLFSLNEPLTEKEHSRVPRTSHFKLMAVILIFFLLAVGATAWWLQSRLQGGRALPLHVTASGQQLRIEWDPAMEVVRQATFGILEIKDLGGGPMPVRLKLGPEILHNGSVLYSKPSDKVSIRLQLVDGKQRTSESMVYFLAREQPPPKVESNPKPEETIAVAIPPAEERRESRGQENRMASLADQEKARAADVKTFRPPPAGILRTGKAQSSGPVRDVVQAPIEPPKIPISLPQPPVTPLIASHTELAPPPPVLENTKPGLSKPGVVKLSSAPVSGRIIWTGELRRGGVLRITDRGPSSGTMNGVLPGGPIKVSVHAAELLDGAIAVYTSGPSARQSAEAPSRRNGWNVTVYKWDPKRAQDVAVVETPAASNGWKQLVVKSINRTTSMIIVDWQQTGN